MRVVQLTDLHICNDRDAKVLDVTPYKSLELVLSDVSTLAPQPDLIIATGDLSEDGSPRSYELLRQLLLDLNVPVLVLPGNHDDVRVLQDVLIGGAIAYPKLMEIGAWMFAALNTQIEGASKGRVRETELVKLEEAIELNPDKPFLVALHHTAVRPCSDENCNLENRDMFLSRLSRFGNMKAVIGGHTHVEALSQYGHIKLMTTPATCVQCVHPTESDTRAHANCEHLWDDQFHGFRILDLFPNGWIQTAVQWVNNPERIQAA